MLNFSAGVIDRADCPAEVTALCGIGPIEDKIDGPLEFRHCRLKMFRSLGSVGVVAAFVDNPFGFENQREVDFDSCFVNKRL
jgi:hypothetical protein